MELREYVISARTVKSGSETFAVPVGEFIQVRKGLASAPEVELQEQCPAGKAWNVRVLVEITETDV